jgi:hypothetical protein
MSTIRRIRDAVRAGSYRFSDHALDEMDDDGLDETDETDVRHVLSTGVVRMELMIHEVFATWSEVVVGWLK